MSKKCGFCGTTMIEVLLLKDIVYDCPKCTSKESPTPAKEEQEMPGDYLDPDDIIWSSVSEDWPVEVHWKCGIQGTIQYEMPPSRALVKGDMYSMHDCTCNP